MEKIRVPELKMADFLKAKQLPSAFICAILAILFFYSANLSMPAVIYTALYIGFGTSAIGLLFSMLGDFRKEKLTRTLETQAGLTRVRIVDGDNFVGANREGKFVAGHVTPDRNGVCIIIYDTSN